MPVDMFEIGADESVSYAGDVVPFAVVQVRIERFEQGPRAGAPERHTFTARAADYLWIQVSWTPASAPQVWVECSYDDSLFVLDRPDRWASTAPMSAAGGWPCRYTPQAMPAARAYELIAAAAAGDSFPIRVA